MKPPIRCRECGQPVDRSDAGTQTHEWYFEIKPGHWRKGLMVCYECPIYYHSPTPAPLHWSPWGAIRIFVRNVAVSDVPESYREERAS